MTHELEVEDITVFDNVPAAFAPSNSFVYGLEEQLICLDPASLSPGSCSALQDDIAVVMMRRAKAGYALDPVKNQEIFDAELAATPAHADRSGLHRLKDVWTWLERARRLSLAQTSIPGAEEDFAFLYMGIRRLITNLTPPPFASSCSLPAPRLDTSNFTSGLAPKALSKWIPVFSSPARSAVLRLCSWWDIGPFSTPNDRRNAESNYETALLNLEGKGEFQKVAALALFHLDLPRAVVALQKSDVPRADSSVLRTAAMALSGYIDVLAIGQPREWHRTVERALLNDRELHPYLKSAIMFLSTAGAPVAGLDGGTAAYAKYNDSSFCGGHIFPRVAFAARFFNDQELFNFLDSQSKECMRQGLVDGLFLVGLHTKACQTLLQQYLDRTADIQTTALLGIFALTATRDALKKRNTTHGLPVLDTGSSEKNQALDRKQTAGGTLLPKANQKHNHPDAMSKCPLLDSNGELLRAEPADLKRWNEVYRHTLNHLGLWSARARLDGMRIQLLGSKDTLIAATVEPRCAECKAGFALDSSIKSSKKNSGSDTSGSAILKACMHCGKPFPRCCVCLLSLTTAAPEPKGGRKNHSRRAGKGAEESEEKGLVEEAGDSAAHLARSLPLAQWFTWCQECRHGGHALHIQEWFESHTTCPVPDCPCTCGSLDRDVDGVSDVLPEGEANLLTRV